MKRGEGRDERRDDFVGKCLKPKKPPDELAQHVSKKIRAQDEFFVRKFRILRFEFDFSARGN